MATAKQLAWRKKFAAMAKAGTLKKATKKTAKKTARKSNPALVNSKHAFWNLAYKYGKYAGLHEATDNPKYEKMANLAFTSLSPKLNSETVNEFEDAYRSGFNAGMREGRKSTNQTTRKSNPVAASGKGSANKRAPYTYDVQRWSSGAGEWINIAGFDYVEDATKYAKSMAKQNPAWTLRVVDNY